MKQLKEKNSGFTLIELLVVIAIIALLLSILIPSLQKAKLSAMNVVCSSNLKQWGTIFAMFTSENDDKFHKGYLNPQDGTTLWPAVTKPYYQDPQILLCPFAKKTNLVRSGQPNGPNPQLAYQAWGPLRTGNADQMWINAIPDGVGSYGINWYVTDIENPLAGGRAADYWRSTLVSNANEIPLFGDNYWLSALPNNDLAPPPNEGALSGGDVSKSMYRIAINRHQNGKVNWLFVDTSVRYVGLKELWTLPWSKTSVPSASRYTIAGNGGSRSACQSRWDAIAPWMSKFPEY